MMDGVLAEARDYGELINALRSRLASLNTTMEIVDDVAGLPLRYSSKIFAPAAIKTLGKVSLGPILGVLGLKLIVAEDAEMFARVRHRLTPRKNGRPEMAARRRRSWFQDRPEIARMLNAKWVLNTTPRQRSLWGKRGADVRWGKR